MLTLVVQAGGESRRMGSDKGLLPFLGQTLIQRVIEPLGGLEAGLRAMRSRHAVVVACDMPFASRELFTYQCDVLVEQALDVVIPSSLEGLEPLHAVYRRETCLPAVRAALQQEEWKLISWFPNVKVHAVPLEEVTRFDLHGHVFMNVNTPADLQQAEAVARRSA